MTIMPIRPIKNAKMKKITKIYKSALVSVALLGFTSCNYLDVVPVETADIDDILTNESSVISQLYSCYSLLQGEAAGYHTVDAVDGLGDECVLPQEWNYRSSNEQYNNITPETSTSWANPWKELYDQIGRVWEFQELLANAKGKLHLNPNHYAQYMGEANFLKAWYHFRLLKYFGPITIVDSRPAQNIAKKDIPGRYHFDYCVHYIDSLLTEAEAVLPEKYPQNSEYSRATSLTCKAVRAQLYQFAASPLWNGSFPDRTWKNTKFQTPGYGYELVSHTYNREKWVKARQACKEAIEAAEAAGCALFDIDASETLRKNQSVPLPTIPGVTDETFRKRVMMLRYMMNATPGDGNNEIIWGIPTRNLLMYDIRTNPSIPRYVMLTNAGAKIGGMGGLSPTLSTVEKFFTARGIKPALDSKFTPESDWFKPASGDVINLCMGREPRFYAWLSFDGDEYSTRLNGGQPAYVHMRDPNTNGYKASVGLKYYCVTGFLSKKYVQPNFYYTGNGWTDTYTNYVVPVIRLAELYLDLAECDAQLGDAYKDEALEYLNRVRKRAGVPNVTDETMAKTGETLLQTILDERFVELFNEGYRYYDIRRYLQGRECMNSSNFYGLNAMVTGPTLEEFNKPTKINQPIKWSTRRYLLPVPASDYYSTPNMVQSPGY